MFSKKELHLRYLIHFNKLAWERDRDNSILCLDGSFPFTEMISIINGIGIRQYVYCLSCQLFLSKYRLKIDHDVGCLNCQKLSPRYVFVKTLSVALAKSSISNIEAIYIKKSVSETVCAKHSLFFVLLYLNQVGLVVCKFTKLVLESFMNYSREVPSVFSLRPTRLIKTVWAIKIVLVYSLVFLFFS